MNLMKHFDNFCVWLYVQIQVRQFELEKKIEQVKKQRAAK